MGQYVQNQYQQIKKQKFQQQPQQQRGQLPQNFNANHYQQLQQQQQQQKKQKVEQKVQVQTTTEQEQQKLLDFYKQQHLQKKQQQKQVQVQQPQQHQIYHPQQNQQQQMHQQQPQKNTYAQQNQQQQQYQGYQQPQKYSQQQLRYSQQQVYPQQGYQQQKGYNSQQQGYQQQQQGYQQKQGEPLQPQQSIIQWNRIQRIENIGNSCYMNSIVQSLYPITELRDWFVSSKFQQSFIGFGQNQYPVSSYFRLIMQSMIKKNVSAQDLTQFKNSVGFTDTNQQDAQEFLQQLLNMLTKECNMGQKANVKNQYFQFSTYGKTNLQQMVQQYNKFAKQQEDSIVQDVFRFYVLKQNLYTHKKATYNIESIQGIHLVLPQGNNSVKVSSLLKKYFHDEIVEDIKLKRIQKLVSLPTILILYVKRYDAYGQRKNNNVIFPLKELDMFEFMNPNVFMEAPIKQGQKHIMSSKYRLISVIHHKGSSLTSGHYYVERENIDVNHKKEWFLISDNNVQRTQINQEQKAQNNTATIFFYRRLPV